MENDKTDKKFTVQRRDTSVPVGGEGCQAGPPGPSSSARELSLVGSQAGADSNFTGFAEEERRSINPFERRESIRRSPPQQLGQRGSIPDIASETGTEDESCKEEETDRPSKKRKAKDSPGTTKTVEIVEASGNLMKVKKKIEDLIDFGKRNSNVHKEVKRMAAEINSMINKCLMESRREKSIRKEIEDENRQYREKYIEKTTADMGCQVEIEYNLDHQGKCNCKKTKEISKADIREMSVKEYKDVAEVLRRDWTRECFEKTTLITGDPLKEGRGNIIFFSDKNLDNQPKEIKRIINRFPDILNSEEAQWNGGSYKRIEEIIKYYEIGHGVKMKNRNVIWTRLDGMKSEEELQKQLYGIIEKCRELTTEFEEKDVTIILPECFDGKKIRKMLEIVFQRIDINIRISASKEETPRVTPRKNKEEAIIIEGTEETYAATLRDLKNKILDTETISLIKNVKRTMRGNMLITVKEGGERIGKKIREEMQDRNIRVVGKDKTKVVSIRDIDCEMTQNYIEDTLKELLQLRDIGGLSVKALRPTFGGN